MSELLSGQPAAIEINGVRLAYELFGEDRPGQPPILLIHGATSTGREDWGLMALLLARHRLVILPDCRGHGRSHGTHSYSFAEMAADMAGLVRALGYDRAHVIGHSNGGNVALVMLVEHPEVVQSAVIQAANAYVSQDLIEREPAVFDPERVRRDAPEWMESMIRLHAALHGADYWRELLAMTLAETIRRPNYTPHSLAKIRLPALVIQGADDPVNAPARHAQFIGAHVPYAETWIPMGVGHTVHDELPAEWLARVENFLDRRGDPLNESLHRLQQDAYRDERDWIFDVRAVRSAVERGKVRLTGRVLTAEQRTTAERAVAQAAPLRQPLHVDSVEVHVLLTEETPWALVNRNVTDLYAAPTIHSGRLSQALLGEAVRILGAQGEWSNVRMERDGYFGWMQSETLHACTESEVRAYQSACAYVVQTELPIAWAEPAAAGDATRAGGKLVFGCRVAVDAVQNGLAGIFLPDGRKWWLDSDALLARPDWPQPDEAGITQTLALVRRFTGIPYLWGGRSPFGYDCSGLTGAFWEFLGLTLPRDADQQRRIGARVEGAPMPGDLLFFRRASVEDVETRNEAVSHVALSLGGGRYIHASGSAWGVTTNSLNPDDADYLAGLAGRLVDARRYAQPGAPKPGADPHRSGV